MLKIAAGAFVVAVLLALGTSTAQAQVLCRYDSSDMAGVYVDKGSPMRVEIIPCGFVSILWDNPHGRHYAEYMIEDPLPGGGVVTRGYRPDARVGYLDNAYTLAVKPGTPGTIEVITVSPYGEFIGMYRLTRI
jgi:hypothetical protein